jgi:glutamate-ammonia-ligase adenylyltransferase
LLDEVTADGFVFRVDTRLRPFGESGPPVVSFAALESYLPQHGRSWERYAYIKARITGPPVSEAVTEELMSSMIEPFVYRRYLDFGVFESLRDMQALIAAEGQKKELHPTSSSAPAASGKSNSSHNRCNSFAAGATGDCAAPSCRLCCPVSPIL